MCTWGAFEVTLKGISSWFLVCMCTYLHVSQFVCVHMYVFQQELRAFFAALSVCCVWFVAFFLSPDILWYSTRGIWDAGSFTCANLWMSAPAVWSYIWVFCFTTELLLQTVLLCISWHRQLFWIKRVWVVNLTLAAFACKCYGEFKSFKLYW